MQAGIAAGHPATAAAGVPKAEGRPLDLRHHASRSRTLVLRLAAIVVREADSVTHDLADEGLRPGLIKRACCS